MRRTLAVLLLFSVSVIAANVRLYLKDGTYQIVREYAVQEDRVHYYSVERSDWEDIPLSLADLKRTEGEIAERKAANAEETKMVAAEEKVEREMEHEKNKIPQDPGVYQLIDSKELRIMRLAESKLHTAHQNLDQLTAQMKEAAEEYEAVIHEHPHTPWARQAAYEMSLGFGIKLVDGFHDFDAYARATKEIKLPTP